MENKMKVEEVLQRDVALVPMTPGEEDGAGLHPSLYTQQFKVESLDEEYVDRVAVECTERFQDKYDLPNVGDAVLANVYSNQWIRATFVELIVGSGDGDTAEVETRSGALRLVPLYDMAALHPPILPCSRGQRVLFKDDNEKHFEPGWIVEEPSSSNKNRYLVLAEERGTARYRALDDLRIIFKNPPSLGAGAAPFLAEVRSLDCQGAERLMVSINPGDTVLVQHGTCYVEASVEEVDCAVALLHLPNGIRQWTYRGSVQFPGILGACERKRLSITGSGVEVKEEENVLGSGLRSTGSKVTVRSKAIKEMLDTGCVLIRRDLPKIGFTKRPDPSGDNGKTGHVCDVECTASCLPRAALLDVLKREYQLGILDWPLLFQYKRHLMKDVTEKRAPPRIVYTAPCGRELNSSKDVCSHLWEAKSCLTMDMFSFQRDMEVRIEFVSSRHRILDEAKAALVPERLRKFFLNGEDKVGGRGYLSVRKDPSQDLTNGGELLSIHCVNEFGTANGSREVRRPIIMDSSSEVAATNGSSPADRSLRVCCRCDDGCVDWVKCACRKFSHDVARNARDVAVLGTQETNSDENGADEYLTVKLEITDVTYSYRRLKRPVPTGIWECNSSCACKAVSHGCHNRVAQNPVSVKLEVFMTKPLDGEDPGSGKGWGVRSLQDIPKGTFICRFEGGLLSEERGHENCHLTAVGEAEGPFAVDASSKGSVAKFFNHSCSPNMWRQKVFLNRRSSYVATTAFFSSRLVKAGEELTWDYGYERWEQNADYSDEAEFMDCLCGSFRCKNRLMIRGVNLGED